MENTNNKSNSIIVLLVVIAIVAGGGYFVIKKMTKATATPVTQKFVDSDLAQYAYQIFPGPLSDQTKKMTAGFTIKNQSQPDGSTIVSLTSTNPEYKNQQYTVKSGQSLYFIEKFGGDDNSTEDKDANLKDDTAVLVDSSGNIVSP